MKKGRGRSIMAMNKMAVFMIMALCAVPAYAAKYACPATDGTFIDSDLKKPATYACADKDCSDDCVLPPGSYHDETGSFKSVCNESIAPEFLKDPETDKCPDGTYDIIPGIDQCVDPATDGKGYGYINDSRGAYGPSSYQSDIYGLTADQTWAAKFDYGTVKGIASCNSISGSYAVATNQEFSQTSTGPDCWCKMTEPSASRWVFNVGRDDAYDCARNCAYSCGNGVRGISAIRSGVFGSVEL